MHASHFEHIITVIYIFSHGVKFKCGPAMDTTAKQDSYPWQDV